MIICGAAVLCGLGAAGAAFAAPPKVTSVTLAQPEGSRAAVVSYQTDGSGIATFQFKTNGVPLAGVAWTVAGDISRYIPSAGAHAFTWDAGRDIPEHLISNLTCVVTLWATNAPPPYAAVNLVADAATGLFPVRFWGSEGEVPLGTADVRWKRDWLLLRQIPSTGGATVTLGSPDYETGRTPASEVERTVRITQPFYMGVYEVTQIQWERVGTRAVPSYWSNATWRDERPVEKVSYYDIRSSASGNTAVAGTDWPTNGHAVGPGSFMYVLRAKTGDVLEFDLPTDAQWEYACRAGTAGAWNNGTTATNGTSDANLGLLGRYTRNGGQINTTGSTWVDPDAALGSIAAVTTSNATAATGSYLPNAWGLYDMHGNVYEWCLDYFIADDASLSGDDPTGPSLAAGSPRIRRGGSWAHGASDCRSARRNSYVPTTQSANLGFRIAAPAAVGVSAGQ
jgi:formylglycine-generating enzyme required for sulfatase activity